MSNPISRRRQSQLDALNDAPPGRGESIQRPMSAGADGIRKLEVPKMVQYVQTFNSDPKVVTLAQRVIQLCEAKDKMCEMNTLFQWVKNHFRYVNDPIDKEAIKTAPRMIGEIMTPPEVIEHILGPELITQMNGFGLGHGSLLEGDPRKRLVLCMGCFDQRLSGPVHSKGSGDCDDGATFLATLLAAVGITPRFRFGGQEDDSMSDGCNYHHVWVQGQDDKGDWHDMDVTEKRSKLGWFYEGFSCTGVAAIFAE
jgi:hypothetical protein